MSLRPIILYILAHKGSVPLCFGCRTSLMKCVNGNDILYQSEDFSTSVNIVEQSQQSDGTIYDLQGRRINSLPVKGIYIRDGRKYVVK